MPRRVGEGERVVENVAVTVERLAVEGAGDDSVRALEARHGRIVKPRVEVDQADIGDVFLEGEAPRGGVRDGARGIGAVGIAPLAPGIIGQALGHRAGFVGDDRNRAQMIADEVAHVGGAAAERRSVRPPRRHRHRDIRSIGTSWRR